MEGYIPVANAELFYREIGQGQPIIILHGGPDFDHRYFLPDMDRLADSFRLLYYDQRGRGSSARNVAPETVSIETEMRDLDAVRESFHLESAALLGHSWGAILALEYAIWHPARVSHLILMNAAPASHDDWMQFRRERRERAAGDMAELQAISATDGYQAGDPDTVAEYYRVHFRAALKRPEHVAQVVARLRAGFTKEGILQARAIEKKLYDETVLSNGYNLLPRLERLEIPTLVLHGDSDFIPVEFAAHIAAAIPGSRLAVFSECGHFAFLECRDQVYREIAKFFNANQTRPSDLD